MHQTINYVDINIYPLAMECNAPLACLYGKGAISNDIIIIIIIITLHTEFHVPACGPRVVRSCAGVFSRVL